MGSRVERTHCNAAGPRELGQIVERMGQAVQQLADPAPHIRAYIKQEEWRGSETDCATQGSSSGK